MRTVMIFIARVWMLIVVALLVMLGCSVASAQDPALPKTGAEWSAYVKSAAMAVESGPCVVDSLELMAMACDGYVDADRGIYWLLLFGDPKDREQPTAVVLITLVHRVPIVAWCKPDFCPKGMT